MTVPQAHDKAPNPAQIRDSGPSSDRLLRVGAEVQSAARVCDEKKGENTRILALDPVDSGLADFFLITSALNDRQAQTIADEIELKLKRDYGVLPASVEGRRHGGWILLDYVDFVVHVFMAERRAYYDIERLRKSARPLTPAEFDEELKAALAAKTRAVRSKTGSTNKGASSQRSHSPRPVAAKSSSRTIRTAPDSALKPAKKAARSSRKKAAKE